MTAQNPDQFCITCSIAVLVVRLRQVMAVENAYFRRALSGSYHRIDDVVEGEMGLHLQLQGAGHCYVPVERVESDTFSRMDDERHPIIPEWMIA